MHRIWMPMVMGMLMLMLGCVAPDSAVPPAQQAPSSVGASSLAPPSLPFASLVNPSNAAVGLQASAGLKAVAYSQAELEDQLRPIGAMPLKLNYLGPQPGWQPDKPATEVFDPARLPFDRFMVIAYASDAANARSARITGVEERADALVVHTVEWSGSDRRAAVPETRHVHVIAVPRSSKPVVFAQTQTITLGTEPNLDGVAYDAPVRWKAVPNPLVTEAFVKTVAVSHGSAAPTHARRVTVNWLNERLGTDVHWLFTDDSEVWVVLGVGPHKGAEAQTRVVMSIEDGGPLMWGGEPETDKSRWL